MLWFRIFGLEQFKGLKLALALVGIAHDLAEGLPFTDQHKAEVTDNPPYHNKGV